MDSRSKRRREIVLYAGSGFAQFLKQLEGALVLSALWNRELTVITDHKKSLGFLSFGELLTYSPPRFGVLSEGKLMSAAASRVSEISKDDYETSRGLTVPPNPPLMRALARENFLRESIYTRGYVLPPGPRFHIVTTSFRLSDFLSRRIQEIVNPCQSQIGKCIGIHLRNTDRTTDLRVMTAKLRASLSQRGPTSVFLASDDEDVAEQFKRAFPKTEFFQLKRPFSTASSAQNLHFGVDDKFAEAQLFFALSDIYLLSRCRLFIPAHKSKSQWTHLIRAMRTPWGQRFMKTVNPSGQRD